MSYRAELPNGERSIVRGNNQAEAASQQEIQRLQDEYGLDYFAASLVAATEMDGVAEGATVHAVQTYCDQLNYNEDMKPSKEAIKSAKDYLQKVSFALQEEGITVKGVTQKDLDAGVDAWMRQAKLEKIRQAGIQVDDDADDDTIEQLYLRSKQ